MRRSSLRYAAVLAGVIAALYAAVAPADAPGRSSGAELLPDLDQAVPTGLEVQRVVVGGRPVFRLGFASAAANVGDGPLTLHGRRRSPRQKTMDVDQLVERTSGPSRVVPGVGRMSYVVHPDHDHWHLLGFERYEIRVPGDDLSPLRRDRKTGFCLGDRFRVHNAKALAGFSRVPMQADQCGLGEPSALGLFSGISVGYVDRYEPQIEGQFIDVTGLPNGRYELVHTVNTEGRIVERDYANNSSSVLFSLRWPRRGDAAPRVRVLRRCPATASCG